jgi:hypothetical protein
MAWHKRMNLKIFSIPWDGDATTVIGDDWHVSAFSGVTLNYLRVRTLNGQEEIITS